MLIATHSEVVLRMMQLSSFWLGRVISKDDSIDDITSKNDLFCYGSWSYCHSRFSYIHPSTLPFSKQDIWKSSRCTLIFLVVTSETINFRWCAILLFSSQNQTGNCLALYEMKLGKVSLHDPKLNKVKFFSLNKIILSMHSFRWGKLDREWIKNLWDYIGITRNRWTFSWPSRRMRHQTCN